MQARCIVHIPVNNVELREIELPEPGPGEIISEAIYTSISPGTELRVMRIHPEGKPLLPGYNHIGRVLKRGPGVTLAEGTLIYASGTKAAPGLAINWGGHISHALLPAATAIPLPPVFESEQGLRDACLIKPAAIAYRGLNHSKPMAGERVAVIGLGMIGQLSARLHAMMGCQVVGTDLAASRVAVANAVKVPGLSAVVAAATLKETFAGQFGGVGPDVVVDCTGDPEVLRKAVWIIRDQPWDDTAVREPQYIVQCSYPGDFVVPYGPAFQRNVSFHLPRDCTTMDRKACVELIGSGRLNVAGLLTVRKPEEAAGTYAELREPGKTELVTVAFKWS